MELYYFSATGNTLTTAKQLAAALGDCKLIPIAALRDMDAIPVTDDAVGFLFPVYNGDMPYIIRSTIARMKFEGEPYIFAVCTYRGNMGPSGARLNDVLARCGQKLSLYQGVSLPGNSWPSSEEHIRTSLAQQSENVKAAAERIKARETEDYTAELPAPSPFEAGYANVRGVTVDETCIGCGTCATVCPMGNIELTDSRAEIGSKCLTCLACFHWCPVEAIYMANGGDSARRTKYHHPDVTLDDIIAQKSL